MGIQDLFEKKIRKGLNEAFANEPDPNAIQTDEVEKASYSEYSYKKVQKLREKGKYWGYDVPYLQHPVTKPEKPRALFIVFGIISAIMLAVVCAFSVFITINFLLPLIGHAIGISGLMVPQQWDIFGVAALFGSIVPLMLWLIVFATIGLIICAVVGFVLLTRKMFSLSKISVQEMAVGFEINNMIIAYITMIVITLVIGIFLLVKLENSTPAGIALIVGIMCAVVLVLGTLIALIFACKNKAKKQFNQLPEDVQKDFINHNRMLERVARIKNIKSGSGLNSSTVDF